MVKHTQTIRRQFADELFACVWPFSGIGTYRVKIWLHAHDVYSYVFVMLKQKNK